MLRKISIMFLAIFIIAGFVMGNCSLVPENDTLNTSIAVKGSMGSSSQSRDVPGLTMALTVEYIKVSGPEVGETVINGPLTANLVDGVSDEIAQIDLPEGDYDYLEIGPMSLDFAFGTTSFTTEKSDPTIIQGYGLHVYSTTDNQVVLVYDIGQYDALITQYMLDVDQAKQEIESILGQSITTE